MKVGLQLSYQNFHDMSDADMFRTETKLGIEAEAMGFDFVAPVEHHFFDYAMCPDNTQVLSYIAAKTKTIQLMTGAVILPWNDPLRVVEKAAMLDILSEGRMILGMARGLSRHEYRGFRAKLEDAREMFDEAAQIVLRGLETGIVEGDGKWFKQPAVEVRPRIEKSFRDRVYMVGMSPSSVDVAARLGVGTLKFSQGRWDEAMHEVHRYKDLFQQYHQRQAPPFIICDFLVCFDDPAKNKRFADTYFRKYYESVAEHYELGAGHFADIPSYKIYADMSAKAVERGIDKAYQDYIEANLIGTPDEIFERHLRRVELVGDYDITLNVSYGGMPFEDSWDQMKRFADKLMPRLKETAAARPAPVLA